MKIWLDDERPKPQGFDLHITSAAEAIRLLSAGGVSSISLDHDLGPEQYGTGYDVACFIEEGAFRGTLSPMEVNIHSANPVGRDRMTQAINRAKEYWTSAESNTAQGIIILVAGDLHFNKAQFQWLEEQRDDFDCFCLTGDFLDDHSGTFEEQTEWVSNWLKKLDKQEFICSGNHDLDEFADCHWLSNLKSPKICRDNQQKLFNGIKFGCIPYLGADLLAFHDCDVLLSHVPPIKTATSRSMVSGKLKDWGDKELYHALQGRVVTPSYILCGHVENPSAKRDCLFGAEIINPGGEHGSSVPGHARIVIPKLPMSNYGTPSV